MSAPLFRLAGAGKRYRLYSRQRYKLLDLLGLPGGSGPGRSRDVDALRDVTLSIFPGERVGLIGRNGAGKTTLLRLLFGAMAASEGEVTRPARVRALLELGSGFFPDFTGRENVRALLSFRDVSGAEADEAERAIERFADLGEYFDAPVRTYSAGMFARLAFAAETADRPEALLVDEAFGVGDLAFLARSRERILDLCGGGGALVLASHDPAIIARFCTRCLWIEAGAVAADGAPLDVTLRYEAFLRAREAERATRREASREDAHRRYGSGEAWIVAAKVLDGASNERTDFASGEPFAFEVEIEAREELPALAIASSVYHADLVPATMIHRDLGPAAKGRRIVRARFREPLLGPGDYSASVGLYRSVDLSRAGEGEPLCVLDRALRFRILPPDGVRRDTGRFRHPVEWETVAPEPEGGA